MFGWLREAWERGITEILLTDTVDRYRRAIETKRVAKLHDITIEDCVELEEGMTEDELFTVRRTITGNLWAQLDALIDLLVLVNINFRLKGEPCSTVSAYNAIAVKEMIVKPLQTECGSRVTGAAHGDMVAKNLRTLAVRTKYERALLPMLAVRDRQAELTSPAEARQYSRLRCRRTFV